MNHRERPTPLGFDEERALEHLQNLHREIQRARRDRDRAEAEFDAFLEGCRKGEPAPEVKAVVPAREAAVAVPEAPQPPEPDLAQLDALPDPLAGPVPPAARVEPPRPLVAPAPRRNVSSRVAIPIAALALIAAIVVVRARRDAAMASDPAPAAAVATIADDSAVESSTTDPAPEAAAPAAPAPPEAGVTLELVTRRPVWVRVMVDGRRAIERELAAGQRIPLRADRSIVIRAGDAGALTVRPQGGEEAALGADGVVATREFVAERIGPSTPPR